MKILHRLEGKTLTDKSTCEECGQLLLAGDTGTQTFITNDPEQYKNPASEFTRCIETQKEKTS